jgi:hypothetical protein
MEQTLEELKAQIKAELDTLNLEQLSELAGGLENRGMDCVIQRWYLPDEMRSGAISKFAAFYRDIERLFSEATKDITFEDE